MLLLVFHEPPIQAVGKVSENKTEIGSVLISDMSSLNLLTISLSEMLEVRLTDLTFDRPLEREREREREMEEEGLMVSIASCRPGEP